MIIGTLVETTIDGSTTRELNGASSVIFYTMADAIVWARLQSESWTVFGDATTARCAIMIVNTDTSIKRWWYNGIEHTG